jgi:hypothetical protein
MGMRVADKSGHAEDSSSDTQSGQSVDGGSYPSFGHLHGFQGRDKLPSCGRFSKRLSSQQNEHTKGTVYQLIT